MRKLYFAHPINTYGTPLEQNMLKIIRDRFPDHEIVNPSDRVHVDAVEAIRAKDPKANVMPYFIALVDSCATVVALPFGDGMLGAGVWAEVNQVYRNAGDVWLIIDPANCLIVNVPRESQGADCVPRTRLSVEETRARIRNPDGTSRPYA